MAIYLINEVHTHKQGRLDTSAASSRDLVPFACYRGAFRYLPLVKLVGYTCQQHEFRILYRRRSDGRTCPSELGGKIDLAVCLRVQIYKRVN
jgi:hypothetical protein